MPIDETRIPVPDDVPAEIARATGARSPLVGCVIFGVVLLAPVVLYFGFFAAVILDEEVFRTRWFVDFIPESTHPFLQTIYAPLIWALDQFDG